MGEKNLASLGVLSIENQLLIDIAFSSVWTFLLKTRQDASAFEFSTGSFLIVTCFIIIIYFVKSCFQ